LQATTAVELMTPNPVSVRAEATLREVESLLVGKGIGAAPVIDEAGRPVGVLSQSDLIVRDGVRESCRPWAIDENPIGSPDDPPRARDLMTSTVFAVGPQTGAAEVIASLLALKVHRLFVVDDQGVLIGVISTMDVLRNLGEHGMVSDN